MKVILLQDVAKVGKKFDIKEVNDGYGRNFLIARGKAKAITDTSREAIEKLKASLDSSKKVQLDLLSLNLKKVGETELTITAKTNPEGHLFAGVHRSEIVDALNEQSRIEITEDLIKLDKPIKQTGEYVIDVASQQDKVKLKLKIVGQEK